MWGTGSTWRRRRSARPKPNTRRCDAGALGEDAVTGTTVALLFERARALLPAARPRTTCGEATPSVTRVAPEGTDDASQIRLPGRPHRRRGTDSSQRPSVVTPGACFGREASSQLLATVSFADVAAEVFGALQTLDLDDLDAGPRPGGYVEPSEAAWNAIEKW